VLVKLVMLALAIADSTVTVWFALLGAEGVDATQTSAVCAPEPAAYA
jgi:hypothetical protein